MLTISVLMFAKATGSRVEGVGAFILADLILAWIIMSGLVKIFGGA